MTADARFVAVPIAVGRMVRSRSRYKCNISQNGHLDYLKSVKNDLFLEILGNCKIIKKCIH